MKLGIFVAFALLGLLTLTEGKFPRLRIEPHGRLNPEDADKITSEVENAVNEEWQKHTEADAEDETLFTATKLKSDIRGKLMYTLKQERKIYAYQGFRFGKAPPEDLGNYWSDHLGDEAFNATHIGLKCPQGNGGDEDCLFLNVYTPYKPGTNDAKNLTVMFFIHGGAFVLGSSASYMPTKLLNHDVILVTTHYRLGAFGFYTRNSRKAPGNLAFYDMISALRWVQNYITDFGGNPDLVTIFGESAGSVSVNYMMLLTKEEVMLLDYLIPNDLVFNDTYKREGMMRDLLLSVGISDEPEGIARSLQRMYCDGVDLANLEEAQYCLIDIGGILFLKAGSWQMSNYHSYFSTHKTFYYSFEFESDDMVGEVNVKNYSFYAGVSHGDEIKYIFPGLP
ncbi:Acylcarnitine hydrolase [Armadillidium nasatum]|uniref:Carboxylic ester hydrolase n=1 Tax=Armadillidium nasatum TaxID=96803 RepID=A0A5N5TAJ5_9CRUS|nr:Acylcarnitine hydrolase [Armadillidium nasatum]